MSEYGLVKLISVFLYPLGATFLIAVAGSVIYLLKRHRIGRVVFLSAFAWLWICSMPATSNALQRALERQYNYQPVEAVPGADLIVVLGGAFGHTPAWPYPDANGNVDRYLHGARLYHAGRAQTVLLSGARDPRIPDGPTEAQLAAVFMTDLGVPAESQILDNMSTTTYEHVGNVARLLDENDMESFLLVTSAIHMRRVEAVFRAGGLDPIPVATDFHTRDSVGVSLSDFLPNVHSLSGSTAAMHEYIGYWYYRLRGWA